MCVKDRVEQYLQKAISLRASDMFFLPKDKQYEFSCRLASKIVVLEKIDQAAGIEIINYLKYQAQMDITEHRRPQVGSWEYLFNENNYYLRLSSLGDFLDLESVVIRIIYQLSESNYFFKNQLTKIQNLAINRGLIITSGPTGSGKTTTMYELARKISQQKLVMTIEDPVEIKEASFLQTQVNLEAEISYETLLKAALRHRPDILIIGEIRDQITAKLAVNAALSGHLVLATVHAKSSLQTIARLAGLGIKQHELANCLTAVTYQRLIPSRNGLCALLDIAEGEILKANLLTGIQNNFVSWQENLTKLRETGVISNETFAQFKNG